MTLMRPPVSPGLRIILDGITHSSACSAGARKRLSATDAKGQISDATYISAHVFNS